MSEEGDSPRAGLPAAVRRRPDDSRLYQCGPQGLMAIVCEARLADGWPFHRLQSKAFGPTGTPEVADNAATLPFEVVLASCGRVFSIPPDRTIAQVLAAAGVAVPLSCEAGICRACLTPVLSGEIDHRDEVTGGVGSEIALCCSRARSGRLVIDM